jgi:phage head maturation protease
MYILRVVKWGELKQKSFGFRGEDHKFEASLDYIVRLCLKNKQEPGAGG